MTEIRSIVCLVILLSHVICSHAQNKAIEVKKDKYIEQITRKCVNDSFFIRTTPFYYVYRLSAKPINTDTIFKPWKCVGVFKDNSEFEGGYKLIMKEDGQVVNVEPSRVIRYDTSQILIKKYGVSDFYLILQGAINKGWTKQMVILSIGKPTKEEYKESIYYWIYGSDEDIQTYYYFNSSGHLMSMATD